MSIKQLVLLFVVIVLSAGAYSMIYVGPENIQANEGGDISLPSAAVLLGTALLLLGSAKREK